MVEEEKTSFKCNIKCWECPRPGSPTPPGPRLANSATLKEVISESPLCLSNYICNAAEGCRAETVGCRTPSNEATLSLAESRCMNSLWGQRVAVANIVAVSTGQLLSWFIPSANARKPSGYLLRSCSFTMDARVQLHSWASWNGSVPDLACRASFLNNSCSLDAFRWCNESQANAGVSPKFSSRANNRVQVRNEDGTSIPPKFPSVWPACT